MEVEEPESVECSQTFFSDKSEVLTCMNDLFTLDSENSEGTVIVLTKAENLLMKYQELPSLLNPAMNELCEPILDYLIAHFEENGEKLDRSCKFFYLFCRIRGYKNMVKFFPHKVEYLEKCLAVLSTESIRSHCRWETRYTLLLWMRILCLIPFDISSMDSALAKGQGYLVKSISSVCYACFTESGPVREISAYCLGTLLTRPDMENHYLDAFITNARLIIKSWIDNSERQVNGLQYFEVIGNMRCICHIYKSGTRECVGKFSADLLSLMESIQEQDGIPLLLRKYSCKLLQRLGLSMLRPQLAPWRYQRGRRTLLNSTSTCKTNLGVSSDSSSNSNDFDSSNDEDEFDIPSEIESIVGSMLNSLKDVDTIVRWSAAKGLGRLTMRLPQIFASDILQAIFAIFEDPEDDAGWHGSCLVLAELARRGLLLPSSLSQVFNYLPKALVYSKIRGVHTTGAHVRDAACYLCWACARAYSADVLQPFSPIFNASLITVFLFDREINCRRAASAAYQECVGRLGLTAFPYGLEIMAIADYFSVGNVSHSYTVLAPKIAEFSLQFRQAMIDDLLTFRLNHWDVNIRIMASRSIALLMALDPLNASSTLGVLILRCHSGVDAWERHGALLALSESLLILENKQCDANGTRNEKYAVEREYVDPSFISLHRQLNIEKLNKESSDKYVKIVDVPVELNKQRLFRGKGGDIVREATCQLIGTLCEIGYPIPVKIRLSYLEFLVENLKQPFDHIQMASTRALHSLLHQSCVSFHYPVPKFNQLTLQKFLASLVTDSNVAVTRGYALALSSVVPEMLIEIDDKADKKDGVDSDTSGTGPGMATSSTPSTSSSTSLTSLLIATLEKITQSSFTIAGEPDVETRRNALISTAILALRFIQSDSNLNVSGLIVSLCQILLNGCRDYSLDNRGDTGSWCRSISLQGLFEVLRLLYNSPISSSFHGRSVPITVANQSTLWSQETRHSFAHNLLQFYESSRSTPCSPSAATSSISSMPCASSTASFVTEKNIEVVVSMDSLFRRVLEETFRMIAEKIDSIRDLAGHFVVNLLLDSSWKVPSCLFVERDAVLSKLLLGGFQNITLQSPSSSSSCSDNKSTPKESQHVNDSRQRLDLFDSTSLDNVFTWKHYEWVFQFLGSLLQEGLFVRPIISGMIATIGSSCGKLTLVAEKELGKTLQRIQNSKKSHIYYEDVIAALNQVLETVKDRESALLPVIRTLDSIIKGDQLSMKVSSCQQLIQSLLPIIRKSLFSSKNFQLVQACIDISGKIIALQTNEALLLFDLMCCALGHKYPHIRKYTAGMLFIVCMNDGIWSMFPSKISLETIEIIQQILTNVQWEREELNQCRKYRDQIFHSLNRPKPDFSVETSSSSNATNTQTRSKRVKDELDSYSTLVRDAGY